MLSPELVARVYVRTNRKDDKTRELLRNVIMKDQRPDWVAWAKERLAVIGPTMQPTSGSSAGEKGDD